jgi:hypothetical protein
MMPESKKLATAAQIDAAQKLYEKMEYWRLEDKNLTELREKDPSLTDQKLTLIKATLVNTFYITELAYALSLPEPTVISALCHLLWHCVIETDLTSRLLFVNVALTPSVQILLNEKERHV